MKNVMQAPPAAQDPPPPTQQRKRPFIYVYDLPPAYNTRMLQYRVGKWVA